MTADTSQPGLAHHLRGRVVLVTGGSRGIGAEVALEAARAGAAVAVGYRTSREAADGIVAQARALGASADAFGADVADAAQVRDLVARVEGRMGRIDGLVTCAAVMATGDFLETDDAEWERVMRADLYSVVFVCRAVLPAMIARGGGSIVNIASRLAVAGAADAAPYAAAKAAVISLTRSLAIAYGPKGVRVNAVSPGTTGTAMGRDVIASPAGQARVARIPIRRFVTPNEVASAVTFLLSDAAGGLTGQTFHVNGGELMS